MSACFGAIGRKRVLWTRIACVSAAMLAATPAARAQSFFGLFDTPESPHQIVRDLEDEGFQFRGPLIRRGDVYVADVVGSDGGRQRLVIDTHSGRVIERYAQHGWRDRPTWRERDLADVWGGPPRPPVGMDGRPPRDGYGEDNQEAPPPRRSGPDREFARGDDGNPPAVVYGDHDAGNGMMDLDRPKTPDTPKPRPHVAKHKTAPAAATASRDGKTDPSTAAAARADASSAATEAPKPTAVAPERAPVVAAKPVVETPKPEVEAAKPPVETSKPVVEASRPAEEAPKPEIETSRPVAEAPKPIIETPKPVAEVAKPAVETPKPVAAAAPSPKPKHKAINDLPVTPLD
jgi:hypothetical protein